MKVCTKCLGNKNYRGMGNIMVNCDECLGVGAVSEEKAEKVKNSENSEKASKPKMIAVKDTKNLKLTNPEGKKFSDINPKGDEKPTKNKSGKIKPKKENFNGGKQEALAS